MNDFPLNKQKLFIETGNINELATIGQKDTYDQFYNYTIGYLEAANNIIERALKDVQCNDRYHGFNQEDRNIMISHDLSKCVLPACFLYRQYLELALKDIYLQYSNDTEANKIQMVNKTSHNLTKVWKYSKPVIEQAIELRETEYLNGLDNYIKQFDEEDPSSMKFRYPINKNLKNFSLSERKINLSNLMERMNEIEHFLATRILPRLDIVKFHNDANNFREKAIEHIKQEKYDEALEQFNKALDVKRQWNGDNHPDIIFLYIEISSIYTLQDNFQKALELLTKALSISNNISCNTYLWAIYERTALNHQMQGNNENALCFYEKSMDYIDKDEPLTITSYIYAARTSCKLKDFIKSKQYYEKALLLSKKILGSDHADTISLIDEIENFSKVIENTA